MTCDCCLLPSSMTCVSVSVTFVTPSVISVAVSVTDATTCVAASFTLVLLSVKPCAKPAQVCIPISLKTFDGE